MGHGSRRPVPPVASNGKHPQHAAFCSTAAYTLSACVQSSIVPNFRCHLTEMKERRPPRACALLCSQDCDALLIPSMYIACLFDSPLPSHTHTHTQGISIFLSLHRTMFSGRWYNRGAISQRMFRPGDVFTRRLFLLLLFSSTSRTAACADADEIAPLLSGLLMYLLI